MAKRTDGSSITATVSDLLAAVARLTGSVQEALASPKLREAVADVRTAARSARGLKP